jgi:hypothetical protein
LATVLAIATAGVVVALNRLDTGPPLAQQCEATASGRAWSLSPAQADNAALIAGIAMRRSLPPRAVTIALATVLQESKLINVAHGDRDSLGLFQQRPSQGWGTPEQIMDPVYATNKFYDTLLTIPEYEQLEVTQAAQAVQRSAFPEAYAQHEASARAWASALTGFSPAALVCRLARVEVPQSAGSAARAVTDRIQRDLGDLPVTTPTTMTTAAPSGPMLDVDATTLAPDDPQRAAWAFAQWAVAVAATTGIDAVEAAGQRWGREHPEWMPAGGSSAADDGPAPGHVWIVLPSPRGS